MLFPGNHFILLRGIFFLVFLDCCKLKDSFYVTLEGKLFHMIILIFYLAM